MKTSEKVATVTGISVSVFVNAVVSWKIGHQFGWPIGWAVYFVLGTLDGIYRRLKNEK